MSRWKNLEKFDKRNGWAPCICNRISYDILPLTGICAVVITCLQHHSFTSWKKEPILLGASRRMCIGLTVWPDSRTAKLVCNPLLRTHIHWFDTFRVPLIIRPRRVSMKISVWQKSSGVGVHVLRWRNRHREWNGPWCTPKGKARNYFCATLHRRTIAPVAKLCKHARTQPYLWRGAQSSDWKIRART
jgi:hypothetical protein